MKALLESRLSDLRRKSFAELAALPASQSEPVTSEIRRITMTVWVDRTAPDVLRVVVQGYRPWFLGLGKMVAIGFAINNTGTLRDLRADELYEFV